MKIYVVGSSQNKFLPLDDIREKYLIDEFHEGDNIDFLNPWYCELTGLYYLWKHVDDEIVGLEHYRNYFWKNGKPINEQEIKEELKKGDIICSGYSYPAWGKDILRTELIAQTNKYYSKFMNAVKLYDEKLYSIFNEYLDNQTLWCCNVFICNKKIINEWCECIFNILASFENTKDFNKNTLRRDGYFAEFLFGAWLKYNNYKIIHCDTNKLTKDLSKTEFYIMGPSKQLIFNN